jgi:hypothetical protein
MPDIDSRIVALERSCRRLRILSTAMLASALLALLSGQVANRGDIAEVVRARKFELIDAAGRDCARLEIGDGGPVLRTYGPNQRPRVALAVDNHGPKFRIFDEAGTLRVKLAANDVGAGLHLSDGKGVNRIVLSSEKDDHGLELYDSRGKHRALVSLVGEEPAINFFNEKGRVTYTAPPK